MSNVVLVAGILMAIGGGMGLSGKIDSRASWACIFAAGAVMIIGRFLGAG